jgi:hypothetical protein
MTIRVDGVSYAVDNLQGGDGGLPFSSGGRIVTHRYNGGRYGGMFYLSARGEFGIAGIWATDIRDAAALAREGAAIQYNIDKARVDEYEAQMKEVLNANS